MALNKHELLKCTEEAVSAETRDENQVFACFNDCCQLGLEILPLDINKSQEACEFESERQLRLGLSALAPGGKQFVEDILVERKQHGEFRSFQDFCERLDLDELPAQFLVQSIEAGAFDSTGESRSRLFNGYERILQGVRKAKADRASQQISLFAILPSSAKSQSVPIELPKADEWTEEERIDHEKQGLGFSFSAYLQQREELEIDSAEEAHEETASLTTDELSDPVRSELVEPPAATSFDTLNVHDDDALHSAALTTDSPATVEIAPEPAVPDQQMQAIPLPPEEYVIDEEEHWEAQEESPEQTSAFSDQPAADEENGGGDAPSPSACIIQLSTQTTTENTLLDLRHLLEQFHGDVEVLLEFIDASHEKTTIKTNASYAVHVSDSLIQSIETLCGQHSTRIIRN